MADRAEARESNVRGENAPANLGGKRACATVKVSNPKRYTMEESGERRVATWATVKTSQSAE